MIYVVGVDVGSTTTKMVLMGDNDIIDKVIVPTTVDCKRTVEELMRILLEKNSVDRIDYVVSTGYGRRLVPFANETVTEITANIKGSLWRHKDNIQTIIDIGGQDTKVISLDTMKKMRNFAMNDKCAAGCGRFLEVMAMRLDVELKEFGQLALSSQNPIKINTTCTVFSESEVISLVAQGKKREDIVAGICKAISHRIIGLVRQVGIRPVIFINGGVIKNQGVKRFIEEEIESEIFIPEEPQFIVAIGASLIGLNKIKGGGNYV